MSEHITSCPRNCYSTCTMKVHVEGGRIRRIEPLSSNRATPEGVCLKGLSYVERAHAKDRILHPLLRDRKTLEFHQISWDDALSLITDNLLRIREESGPKSILYYSGSGTKGILNEVGMNFWKLFGGCTTTYGDLCWPAGLEATRLTLGENKHNAPWDLARSRLIVLWGKNAAETNIHQMVFVDQALQAGATLVTIDPRRTQTCERAHLHLQPRPGTDGALALALSHLLIRDEMIDVEFISKHVLGYSGFAKLALSTSVEEVSRICDVPVSSIEELARMMGSIKPMTINCGYGMQRYSNSGQSIRAILALVAITGNIGRRGAGWVFANLQSHIFSDEQDPISLYPPAEPDPKVRVSISTTCLGHDMQKAQDPPLRMIWVERGNPVTQNPETHSVLEAFRSLEFRVVVDQFMTDTAREADLILPAKTLFEQTDVINAYWHAYVQIKRKLLDPPGEVKPETVIYWELARRLGFSESEYAGVLPGPADHEVEDYLEKRLSRFSGLSLDRLDQGPILAPGSEDVVFEDLSFSTPSGKIELFSEEATQRWNVDPLARYTEPVESRGGKNTGSNPYPIVLLTPNTKNRIHSQFNNLEMIRRLSPKPVMMLHPEDAESRGIDPGDQARVFNDRGELTLAVEIDGSLKVGCAVITNGWWISEGGGVNFLSKARETDMGHGAAFHDNLVEVARVH